MKIEKAVIFDMDGVIVHNDVYHYRSWQIFSEKIGKSLSLEEVKSWFGSTNEKILKDLFDHTLTPEEIAGYAEEKEQIYRDIYAPVIKPLEGLREFLESLDPAEWGIGLATSAPGSNVDFVLKSTGLASFFHQITDDSQISNGKPHPEIFLKTAEKLKVSPAKTLVFEDSFHGIEAARRAGMKVVGVATTHETGKLLNTDHNIRDFRDIDPDLLDKILASN